MRLRTRTIVPMALVSRLIGFDSRSPRKSATIELVQGAFPPSLAATIASYRTDVQPDLRLERTAHYRGVIPPQLYRDNRTATGFQPK